MLCSESIPFISTNLADEFRKLNVQLPFSPSFPDAVLGTPVAAGSRSSPSVVSQGAGFATRQLEARFRAVGPATLTRTEQILYMMYSWNRTAVLFPRMKQVRVTQKMLTGESFGWLWHRIDEWIESHDWFADWTHVLAHIHNNRKLHGDADPKWVCSLKWLFGFRRVANPEDEDEDCPFGTRGLHIDLGVLAKEWEGLPTSMGGVNRWYKTFDIEAVPDYFPDECSAERGAQPKLAEYDPWFATSIERYNGKQLACSQTKPQTAAPAQPATPDSAQELKG